MVARVRQVSVQDITWPGSKLWDRRSSLLRAIDLHLLLGRGCPVNGHTFEDLYNHLYAQMHTNEDRPAHPSLVGRMIMVSGRRLLR